MDSFVFDIDGSIIDLLAFNLETAKKKKPEGEEKGGGQQSLGSCC